MIRTLSLIGILFTLLTNVWWVAIPLSVIYAWRYQGYELFLVAFMVDGFFGQFYVLPYYSLLFTILIIVIGMIRPQVLIYNS